MMMEVSLLSQQIPEPVTQTRKNLLSYENRKLSLVGEVSDFTPQSTVLTVSFSSGGRILANSSLELDLVTISELVLEAYPYPEYSGATAIDTLSKIGSTDTYQQAKLSLKGTLNNGDSIDLTDSADVSFEVIEGEASRLQKGILTPTEPEDFVIEVTVGNIIRNLTIYALNESVGVVKITDFVSEFGSTFSGYQNAVSNINTLGLLLNDSRKLPNIMSESGDGPTIANLIAFMSSDPETVSIDNTTGAMKLLRNSYQPITITAFVSADSSIENTIDVDANLKPELGDADIGSDIGPVLSTLQKGDELSLPIYVNTENATVGVITIRVHYESSVLTIKSRPTAGEDIPTAVFQSSYDTGNGQTRIGAVLRTGVIGSNRMHIADLTFSVEGSGDGYILIDVLTLSTKATVLDNIGDPTPRRSIAGRIDFNVGGSRKRRALSSSIADTPIVIEKRCDNPPCSVEECEKIGTTPPSVGDANRDCVFDGVDSQYTLQQSSDTSDIDSSLFRTMDVDWNGRITPRDSEVLLDAYLGLYPLIHNITIRGIDEPLSECHFTINVTLTWGSGRVISVNETYAVFGIFKTGDSSFQEEFNSSGFAVGSKLLGVDNPDRSYGGWIDAELIGDGLFSVQSKTDNISAAEIGFMLVYGDKRDSPENRNVVVIGNPAPPLTFGPLNTSLPTGIDSNTEVSVNLPAGFNPQQTFDNTFEGYLCFNDHAPQIGQAVYIEYIREDSAIGHLIEKITATDEDFPLPAGDLRFSISFNNQTQVGLLAIDPVSGNLTVNQTLDREAYADIVVVITVTDQGPHLSTRKSDTAEFDLRLIDVNDNPPIPDKTIYTAAVKEAEFDKDEVILTVKASDRDVDDQNKALKYNIIYGDDSDNPFFKINPSTGALTQVRSLDREEEAFYNLTVLITDSVTEPILNATVYLEITVIDLNDEKPVFDIPNEVTITENNEEGAFLFRVVAEDKDIDDNDNIVYSIESLHSVDFLNSQLFKITNSSEYFTIDPSSGNITVKRQLDRESIYRFQMSLSASDGVNTVYEVLFVRVCEENDNSPKFDKTQYVWEIKENSKIGTLIDTLEATDADEGSSCDADLDNHYDNLVYYYSLSEQVSEFIVDETTGKVTVNGTIDYETFTNFTLQIFAEDQGEPPLNTTTELVIQVIDLNDNYPIFTELFYNDSIVENSTVETELGTVIQATDADSGNNSVLRYKIAEGKGKEDFEIDPVTGVISLAKKLDRENISLYELTVVAYDLGSPSLSSNVTLTIYVIDINDSPPVFSKSSYYLLSTDNVPVNDTILTVAATDADKGDDRDITYAPLVNIENTTVPLPFEINEFTGEIVVIEPLCTKQNVTYTMNVTAQDKPSGSLVFETTVRVTIDIYDDNSDAPKFEKDVVVLHAPDGTKAGSEIGSVLAKDNDVCSHPLQYSVVPMLNYDQEEFTYDNETSTLYNKNDFNQSIQSVYRVRLRVEDINSAVVKADQVTVYIVVGQIVPLEITSTKGFPVSYPNNPKSNTYTQLFSYLYDAFPAQESQVVATFGTLNTTVEYTSFPEPATNIEGVLATRTIYYDKPLVYAVFQLKDAQGSDVYAEGEFVHVNVSLGTKSVEGSSDPTEAGAIVTVSVEIPEAWFVSGGEAVVSYRIGADNYQKFEENVTIVQKPVPSDVCSSPGTKTIFWLPTHTLYEQEEDYVRVSTESSTQAVSALAVECFGELGTIEFTAPELYNEHDWLMKYSLESSTNTITIQAARLSNFSTLSLNLDIVKVHFNVLSTVDATTSVECRVISSFDSEGEAVFTNAFVVSRDDCLVDKGEIHLSNATLQDIFFHTSQTVIYNKAYLSSVEDSVPLTITGVYLSDKPYTKTITSGGDCISDDNSILKVAKDCSRVFTNGSEVNGSSSLVVVGTIAVEDLVVEKTIEFEVWFPDNEVILFLSDDELNAFRYCPGLHQSAQLTAKATYRIHSKSPEGQEVFVEELLENYFYSSNASIVEVSGLTVTGKAPGTTSVYLSKKGSSINGEVSVEVTGTPHTVIDLDVYYATDVTMTNKQTTPSEPVQFSASLSTELKVEGESADIVTLAVLDDGHSQKVSASDGLVYETEDPSVITIDGATFIAVGNGSGDLLTAKLICDGNTLDTDPNAVNIQLLSAELVVKVSNDFIVHPDDQSASLGDKSLPVNSTISVLVVYSNGEEFTVTENANFSVTSSPNDNVITMTNTGSPRVVTAASSASQGRATITISYKNFPSQTVTIDVGKSTDLLLLWPYPYPSYEGCCVGANYKTSVSTISTTGVYQKVLIQTNLHVTAGSLFSSRNIDVTESSLTSFSTSLPSDTTVSEEGVFSVTNPVATTTTVTVTATLDGDKETSQTIEVLGSSEDSVTVKSINVLSVGSGDNQTTNTLQISAEVEFSDGTALDNAFDSEGQVIPGLLTFESSNKEVFTVSNSGEVTLLDNHPVKVNLTVSGDTTSDSYEFYSNLYPAEGELDVGQVMGPPIAVGDEGTTFTVPVRINVGDKKLAALELAMSFESDVLSLVSVSAGADWTGAFFSHSENKYEGFVHFGGVLTDALSGTVEITQVTFRPKTNSTVSAIRVASFTVLNISGEAIPVTLSQSANATFVQNAEYNATLVPELPTGLYRLDPVQEPCMSPMKLPCACSNAERGDLNGDCVFDIKDVLYLYQNESLHDEQCVDESHDFNLDRECTENDLVFLLRVNFHQLYFVTDLTILPVSDAYCYLDISASMESRGGLALNESSDHLLFGLFHQNSDFQAQFDGTIISPIQPFGEKAKFTSNNPPSTNGGFFFGTFSPMNETFRVQLETLIDKSDVGFVLVQAHGDAFGEISTAFISVMIGEEEIPQSYPGYLTSSVYITDTWAVDLNHSYGFTPLRFFNQNFSSPRCINENRPIFQPRNASQEVYESAKVNEVIARVFANDSDRSENAIVQYSFFEPPEEITETFAINATTGEVSLLKKLDREERYYYFISVQAKDQGNVKSQVGHGTLEIYVLDTNDEDPVFEPVEYNANQPLAEDTQLGTIVATVTAEDKDLGENGTVYYYLQEPFQFIIDIDTGVIRINQSLNYEAHSSYNLTVEARDGGSPPRSATINVLINVSPVNEHAPSCHPAERRAVVAEDEIVGAEFFTIAVSDEDVGSNHSVLTYEISSNDEFGIKKVSDTEAVLYTLTEGNFDREETPSYNLTVTVRDAGGLSCMIYMTIVVGEPTRIDFSTADDGFLVGRPARVKSNDGHSQNVTFFRRMGSSSTVTATFGTGNRSAHIQQELLPPAHLHGYLYRTEVAVDDKIISGITLQYDKYYSTELDSSDVWLSIEPADGSIPSVAGEKCSAVDGLCEVTVAVPESWFGQDFSSVKVSLLSDDLDMVSLGDVQLIGHPSIEPTTNNLFIKVPYGKIYKEQDFAVWVSSFTSVDLLAFHLELEVAGASVDTSVLSNNDQWSCDLDADNSTNKINYLCFRHNFSTPSKTSYGTDSVFGIEIIASGGSSDVIISATVKSLVSRYGIISSKKSGMFVNKDGLLSGQVSITVADPELVGLFATVENTELFNFFPLGTDTTSPVSVYGVYSNQEYSQVSSYISVYDQNVIQMNSSAGVLTFDTQQTVGAADTTVTFTLDGISYDQHLIVWYPVLDSVWIVVPDHTLNLIEDYQASCGGVVYQSTNLKVFAQFSNGDETSPELDVTNMALSGIQSSSPAVVSISGSTAKGNSTGTAMIQIKDLPKTAVNITVSSEPVKVHDLYVTVYQSLSLSLSATSYSRDSIVIATATWDTGFDHILVDGRYSAYVFYEDGSRQDILSSELMISSNDTDIVDVQITAGHKGNAELTFSWKPSCSAFKTATVPVTVSPPSLVNITITPANTRLKKESTKDISLPSSSTFTVTAHFSDSSEVDVTLEVTAETTGGISYSASMPGRISVTGNSNGVLTVSYVYSSEVTMTASQEFVVVSVTSIDATVSFYGAESVSKNKTITLSQFGNTGIWEIGQLHVTAHFSDGVSEVVDATFYDEFPMGDNAIMLDNKYDKFTINPIYMNGIGGKWSVGYGDQTDNVWVYKGYTPLSIVSGELTVTDTDSEEKKSVTVRAEFNNSEVYSDLTVIDPQLPSKLFEFSITPEAVATYGSNMITVEENHHSLCVLEATSDNNVTFESSFTANAVPAYAQIDLGSKSGIPQPSVPAGSKFTTDVYINRGTKSVFGLEVTLKYDPELLELVSVDTLLDGYTEVRSRSPKGFIKMVSVVVESFGDEEIPKIATVEWEALKSGELEIIPTLRLVEDNSGVLAITEEDSKSLPILITGGSKRSIHKRSSHIIDGDLNGDSQDNVLDLATLVRDITTNDTKINEDLNFDKSVDVYDAVYLSRAIAGLVPYLRDTPTWITVSNSANCELTLTAEFSNASDSNINVFFVIFGERNLLDITKVETGYKNMVFNQSTIFEGIEDSPGSLTYSTSLLTPIEGEVGVSVLVMTSDDDSKTSSSRFISFFGSSLMPSALVANGIENFSLKSAVSSVTLDGINVGREGELRSLVHFTNTERSDYCSFNITEFTTPTIKEDQKQGVVFYNISVLFDGWPTEDVITYKIVTPDTPFDIVDEVAGSLVVDGKLDFDAGNDKYTFKVVAIDNSTMTNIGTATVIVPIEDVNDNAPTFGTNYTVNITEEIPEGSIIVDVLATDGDTTGSNNVLTYTILPDSNPGNLFQVNSSSGLITLAGRLDREEFIKHTLVVEATDSGTPPQTGTALVEINVLDINDNEPKFSASHYIFQIYEDFFNKTNTNTFQGQYVSVSDEDFGVNMTLELSLQPLFNDSMLTFSISNDGYITVLLELDRETKDVYHFNITAKDIGPSPLTSHSMLTIEILDVNDNTPFFTFEREDIIIEEDLPVGTVVAIITADDRDIGTNEQLEYSIKEELPKDSQPQFIIDPSGGQISVESPLVIEDGMARMINVTVTDKGEPPLSNTTSIFITVVEGRIVRFNIGQSGFLVSELARSGIEEVYSQKVQYLTRDDYGTEVEVSSRIDTAPSRSFENKELSVRGGKAFSLRGTILQDTVHYNLKTVSALVQVYDVRDAIAKPTLVRLTVTPFSTLSSLHDSAPIAYCMTSESDGYCLVQATLPDKWFQRAVSDPLTDRVSITIEIADAGDSVSESLGELPVESSLVYSPQFLSEGQLVEIVPPSANTVYKGNSFNVEVYISTPFHSGLFYKRITANVPTELGQLDGFDFDDLWTCSESCDTCM